MMMKVELWGMGVMNYETFPVTPKCYFSYYILYHHTDQEICQRS